MGFPSVANNPGVRPQPSGQLDGSTVVDESAVVAQVPATTTDPAWTAKQQQARVPVTAQTQTVGATAPPNSPLGVAATVKQQMVVLDHEVSGKTAAQRADLIAALKSGGPIPAGMQPIVDHVTATGKLINSEMQSLSTDQQRVVSGLLNFEGNWKNSSELMAILNPMSPAPGAQGMPPNLGAALAKMKDISGALEADILLSAAAKDGMSPQQLVDQITSGKGPIAAAIIPKLGPEAISELAKVLPQTPAGAARYMKSLDDLQALATHNSQPQGTQLMSRQEMQQLLQQHSPLEVADAVLSNQGGLRNRMTLDALNALESGMIPQGPMSPQAQAAYMQRINGLQQLQQGLPATAFDANAAQMALNPASQGLRSNQATAFNATVGAGFMPTGNRALDLASSIAHYPTYSDAETKLLAQITDPQQRAMQELQMQMQKQALLATTLSNLANMRHEMLKTVANNLRA